MNQASWYIILTFSLIAASAVSYLLQISIFHRTEETFFYMLQDIAFVPIQVLLVTLILNQLLTSRERRALLKKLNMLIGAFQIEAGFSAACRMASLYEAPEGRLSLPVFSGC